MTKLRAAALTDIGRVRRENEDRYLLDPGVELYAVADGVGGLPGGGEAAQLALDEISGAFHVQAGEQTPDLVAIVQHANFSVAELGKRISPAMGIGSTLTMGCVRRSTFVLAHVGDSRCYGLRSGALTQLTEDHSVENEARLRRARGEVVYYHEANRNALTRCIGQPTPPDVDIITRPLETGDRYLFCTDGVTRLIRDAELAQMLGIDAEPDVIIRDIVALAVRRGGPDNATGVVIFVDAA